MNHIFKTIWSDSLQQSIVVSELSSAKGKTSSKAHRIKVAAFAAMLGLSGLSLSSSVSANPFNQELPTGGQVIIGDAVISSNQNAMTINQSSLKAGINWQKFNIGESASVTINQPNKNATLLNRVIGSDPSQIFGQLNANGQVILINPNGIVFSESAQVNVGALIASTLELSNEDFKRGHYQFKSGTQLGSLYNLGNISADTTVLVAAKIVNQGQIQSQQVALATGQEVTISFDQEQLISVDIKAADWNASIENGGVIVAEDGVLIIKSDVAQDFMSSVISLSESSANIAVVDDGRIRLVNSTGSLVGNHINIDAGVQGQAHIAGEVNADSSTAKGGEIQITGGAVKVTSSANIHTDGKTGGGQIRIGGSWQNSDNSVRQAIKTTIENGAEISASAIEKGDGGKVVVWSDIKNKASITTVDAQITAEAKGLNHDGGQIETSGHQVIIGDNTRISTLSEQGKSGNWLIDPNDYTIAAAGGDITGTTLSTNLGSGDITIETSTMGTAGGSGDIHVNDVVSWSANKLTLTAERDININATMTASGTSTLDMTANSNTADDLDPFDPLNTADQTRAALASIGRVRVGLKTDDSGFKGKVEFGSRTGTGILRIDHDGEGTLDDFNLVSSLADIDAIAHATLDDATQRIALGTDIDASTNTAISGSAFFGNLTTAFTGHFDGLGHTISGYSISGNGDDSFFGRTGTATIIRNFALTDINFLSSGNYQGAFSSYSTGITLHNSYATGNLFSTSGNSGGLVGYIRNTLDTLIEHSFADVYINANAADAGGLVGYINASSQEVVLSNTKATANVDGLTYSGGLIGYALGTKKLSVLDSFATGRVNGSTPTKTNDYAGGLIGYASKYISLDKVYATGDVFGDDNTGGLIGWTAGQSGILPLTINHSYASGNVVGFDATTGNEVGGLIGEIDVAASTAITNSYTYGTVTNKTNESGALFGSVNAAPTLSNVYWNSANTETLSLTGSAAKNAADFASMADTDLGSNSVWQSNGDYAYPVLALSNLDDRLSAYKGNVIDVSLTSGSAGSATVIDGVSVFDDDATIVIDTLNTALASGQVIIKTGGLTSAGADGDITLTGSINNLADSLSLIANNDIDINQTQAWNGNRLSLNAGRDINVKANVTVSGTGQLDLFTNSNSADDLDPFSQTAAQTRSALATIGRFSVDMLSSDRGFSSQLDYTSSGQLSINGESHQVITSLSSTANTDLDEITMNHAGVRYALGSDIDATALSTQLGADDSIFKGALEGLGHVIDGMSISGDDYNGLFANFDKASASNLGITNASVYSSQAYWPVIQQEQLSIMFIQQAM